MENTVKFNEIEEVENIEQDVVNTPEESNNNAALVAGMIGGFLAYAIVSGGKKLVKFVGTKVAGHEAKKGLIMGGGVDANYTEVADGQESDENAEN